MYNLSMLVLIHVGIALFSIIFASFLFFWPSKARLKASYLLVVATVASGTALVISTHSPMVQACLTGLIYLGVVFSLIGAASYKLQKKSPISTTQTD